MSSLKPFLSAAPLTARPFALAGLLALGALPAMAQNYTVVDLTPAAGNAGATGFVDASTAAGYAAAGIFDTFTHAMLWTSNADLDLHPSFLDDPSTGARGRSAILGAASSVQVGWGSGPATSNRWLPMVWNGTAASGRTLSIPFAVYAGQALATDGAQIVGYATGFSRDGTTVSPSHALVWDAASGVATDLGDGGNGAVANGVGGGAQVGHVFKSLANAALWRGSDRSLVILHPKNAVISVANATDGTRQVGYAGFDVRARVEAAKGNKDARFNYAYLWSGTAASAVNIHPNPVNALTGVNLAHSFALGLQGSWIVGYAGDSTRTGTPAYSHAIVWDASLQSVDLNAFLPAGFVGAQASSVDAAGNVAGFMAKADGTRHAVVWLRQ